ncbi:MAG: hypothetical protein R3C52_12785 [Hyphomonadaceae bacterium]
MVDANLLSGRDALHRLDRLIATAREEFDLAVQAAEAHKSRRSEIARLKADGFRQLAAMRIAVLREGELEKLGEAETRALRLLEGHAEFLDALEDEAHAAEEKLSDVEARRRLAEAEADAAHEAYETQVAATENRLTTDEAYQKLKAALEHAQAVAVRAEDKLLLARTDRDEKGEPYRNDPLFSYLWKRKFRTPEYRAGGLIRMLDNWVAKTCGYDAAWLNYARLTELPDRLAEHLEQMKVEAAEAEAAIEAYEDKALESDGAGRLSEALKAARARLNDLDGELAAAENARSEVRARQEAASSGDAGPEHEARAVIEAALEKASFPDLRVLAAETATLDDDRIVDILVKLRTEELQMEVGWRNVEALPARRRTAVEVLERARRKFKEAGFDNPYVTIAAGSFEAAVETYGRGAGADAERLWREIASSVRQAPRHDDRYFGGARRRDSIGLPRGAEDAIGVVLGEVIRQSGRSSRKGGWGGGGPWSGGSSGKTRPTSLPSSGKTTRKRGGFKTRGRF